MVIGAQKSGTSGLCDMLARHPGVFLTTPKEPYFFSHDEVYSKGLAWYRSLFDGAKPEQLRGEGSTTYTQAFLYPKAAERVAQTLPNVKLIFMARDPVERIRSHWMHLRSRENRETRPFNEAVRARPEYLDHSRYEEQLARYRSHYGDDAVLVLFFEDYRRDPTLTAQRCFRFLGVDASVDVSEREEARHASGTGRVDSRATTILRRIPGFRSLRDAMPTGLREVVRRLLKKPIGAKPDYDDDTRAWVIEQLRPDTEAFLARYRTGDSPWSDF